MSGLRVEDQESAIPVDVLTSCEAFREWARSGAMPERGRFAYLGNEFWMDMSREDAIRHNLLRGELYCVLAGIVKAACSGYFYVDGMLLTHPRVGLSTEPDGFFVSYEAIRDGRCTEFVSPDGSRIEIIGSPDMTLEVVSRSSVRKDTVILRDLYYRAGVREYWIVDARKSPARFEILKHTPAGYVPAEPGDGWQLSDVFQRSFRLEESTDPLGRPRYTLSMQ